MASVKKLAAIFVLCFSISSAFAQETYPVNGVADSRNSTYAFTNANVYKDGAIVQNATLVIKRGRIVAVGQAIAIPAEAIVSDCKGKYIYPSFIDMYSDYGIGQDAVQQSRMRMENFFAPMQITTNTKGAYGWNQALRSYINTVEIFAADEARAKQLRDNGFGAVLTHQRDGIARGTAAVVSLGNDKENLLIIKDKAAAAYSFSKGSSNQSYPSSVMGSIALLRQSFLDGQWYKNKPATEGTNLSLQAWNENLSLPKIFEANDKWGCLRADRIAKEFGYKFILKAGGNEYQRINEMKATGAAFILPLNFPQAMDVEDPNEVRFVDLATLKHWEMAPTNPAAFEKAGISFCLTADGIRDIKQFLPAVKKAIDNGLSEQAAMLALTKTPATLLNIYNETGSIEVGKIANFIIASGPLFQDKTSILQNWVQGKKYVVKDEAVEEMKGVYALQINLPEGAKNFTLNVKSNSAADITAPDTVSAKLNATSKFLNLSFTEKKKAKRGYQLSGINYNNKEWNGTGTDSTGKMFTWTAAYVSDITSKPDSSKKKPVSAIGKLTFPNMSYGFEQMPVQQTYLLKNATVWTSEKEGILQNTDVLLQNGKIASVGKNLSAAGAIEIDATSKHITPGIIDEHSHIAVQSINESGQSVSSEVRIGDNLNPDDINIYRQLSGGVTTSHILHGSANTIGGQTQLIKLRWGANDEDLKFKGADGFIKFALGENVKRTSSTLPNNRFPNTRMGVEQVQMDAFTRAADYKKALAGADSKTVRRDLELDALVEIMDSKRFITCHSYVASEIIETMRIAERFGFKVNTFTHILEGYKVADKMKKHGANASTFSDWWAYKLEVQDAIAYNAAIMHNAGLNVAINSDDAEMARRLNQEAAKSIKYGNMNEEDVMKMVTINPAKMLHINNRVGSIAVGKDADVVIWSANPTSVYAKAEKTFVDGILYFDREKDLQLRQQIAQERNRLIQKMMDDKKSGAQSSPAMPSFKTMQVCTDHLHNHGLLVVDEQ